jgi:hypothetical protein
MVTVFLPRILSSDNSALKLFVTSSHHDHWTRERSGPITYQMSKGHPVFRSGGESGYRSTRPEKGGKKTRERTRKKRVVHHGLGKRVINVT